MKNFLIYECLLPTIITAVIVMPLLLCGNVHPGRTSDTYQVDGYGSVMAPTKEEMSPTGCGKGGGLIYEDSIMPKASSLMCKPQY